MQSIIFSIRSKCLHKLLNRGQTITRNYGLTPAKIVQALDQFSQILREFQCGATFPTTAVAIERNGKVLKKYIAQGIEFALHGYRHIDYAQLTLEEQMVHLRRAQDAFTTAGIPVTGFRAPYLHFNKNLRTAASEIGLKYVSNQAVLWKVFDGHFSPTAQMAYERALAFYMPWYADEQPSLPHWYEQLIEIPVSLPDDEILLDRLGNDNNNGLVEEAWSRILTETHQREELFALQLHPERITRCMPALSSLLTKARALDPPVWMATLEEIATWWRARSETTITVSNIDTDRLSLVLKGPKDSTILIRNVEVNEPTYPWINGYRRCETQTLVLKTHIRPFVGVPIDTSPEVVSFLQQQGYIVERSDWPQDYSIYLNQFSAIPENKRSLLNWIEEGNKPLVRLGRWPNNTCSALAVTGDIDALTIWDYGLRYLGY